MQNITKSGRYCQTKTTPLQYHYSSANYCAYLRLNDIHPQWCSHVGQCSDSMTIVIVSVTITTVIVKNYYRDSGHVVSGMCI